MSLKKTTKKRNMAVKVLFNILGEFHYHIKKNGNFQKKRNFSFSTEPAYKILHLFPSREPLSISPVGKRLYRIITLLMYDLAWHKCLPFFYPYLKQQNPPQALPKKNFKFISIHQTRLVLYLKSRYLNLLKWHISLVLFCTSTA